jgi:AcrR family transcriptional regulator
MRLATEHCPVRAMRADARRNLEKVLVAAEEAFAIDGVTVPVDEIARRAGVGVGTLYRHFPTKASLVQAVVMARLCKFLERAYELAQAPDPGHSLFVLVQELVQLGADKKDLTDELARAGVGPEELHFPAKEELERVMGDLLSRAQDAGSVRRDIGIEDLASLIMGTCMAADHQGHQSTERLVGVMCDGLRTVNSPRLAVTAPA